MGAYCWQIRQSRSGFCALLGQVGLALILIAFPAMAAVDYNPDLAITYARQYCDRTNTPAYEAYGADCANYVSQCLRAGGLAAQFQAYAGEQPGAVDDKGAIPSCTNLHDFLANYLQVTTDTRAREGNGTALTVPAWFGPGDVAIFHYDETPATYRTSPPSKHAVFATGLRNGVVTCSAHSGFACDVTIDGLLASGDLVWAGQSSPSWRYCTFYDVATATAPQSATGSGLVAYYPFDGDLEDASGNANDGTASGAVSFTLGRIGQAVKLGGVDNVGYIRVPNSPSLAIADELTWMCDVRVDSSFGQTSQNCSGYAVAGAPQCILAKRGDRSGLWANVYLSSGTRTLKASFGANSYTSTGIGVESTFPYAIATWVHLAFVYSSGLVIEYADGVEVARRIYSPTDFSAANAADLYIGIQQNNASEACSGQGPNWWYPLNGAIDDLRIYNRALSPSEVAAAAVGQPAAVSVVTPAPLATPPDLIVADVTYGPTNVQKDDTVAFSITVRNQGASDAGGFRVNLAGTAAHAGASFSGLAAGASATAELSLQLSQNSETFTATVDDLGQVAETNEANNTEQTTVVAGSADGLVAYYPFDGAYNDAAGGATSTPSGHVGFVAGVAGQALKLHGVTDPGWVSVPNSPSLALSDRFSVAFWARIDDARGMGNGVQPPNYREVHCILGKSGDRIGLGACVGSRG